MTILGSSITLDTRSDTSVSGTKKLILYQIKPESGKGMTRSNSLGGKNLTRISVLSQDTQKTHFSRNLCVQRSRGQKENNLYIRKLTRRLSQCLILISKSTSKFGSFKLSRFNGRHQLSHLPH